VLTLQLKKLDALSLISWTIVGRQSWQYLRRSPARLLHWLSSPIYCLQCFDGVYLGGRKGIRPVKNWVVRCWRGYLSGARCRFAYAQLMPLPLTVSCFSKIQIGFTFLVPAHLGSPGKKAVKWLCVCVCVQPYLQHNAMRQRVARVHLRQLTFVLKFGLPATGAAFNSAVLTFQATLTAVYDHDDDYIYILVCCPNNLSVVWICDCATTVIPIGGDSRSEVRRLRAGHTEGVSSMECQETLHPHAIRRYRAHRLSTIAWVRVQLYTVRCNQILFFSVLI